MPVETIENVEGVLNYDITPQRTKEYLLERHPFRINLINNILDDPNYAHNHQSFLDEIARREHDLPILKAMEA